MKEVVTRDVRFDVLKGAAILIVILGHVMQYSIPDFGDTLAFNFIWSIQIPLFMVVSGYFSISRHKRSYIFKLKRKALRYLIPFMSYFIISTFINNDNWGIESVRNLIWHLEASLWYIFVLFILSATNDIVDWIMKCVLKIDAISAGNIFCHTIIYFIWVLPWLGLIFLAGSTFLGAKFIVYYSIYFWIGWIWRTASENMNVVPFTNLFLKYREILYAVAVIIFAAMILKVNLYRLDDTVMGVIPRLIASMCGVFVVISFLLKTYGSGKLTYIVAKIGEWSLEFYYVHMLICRHLVQINTTGTSVWGIVAVAIYFVTVTTLSLLLIKVIKLSDTLNFVLFGIVKKNKYFLDSEMG